MNGAPCRPPPSRSQRRSSLRWLARRRPNATPSRGALRTQPISTPSFPGQTRTCAVHSDVAFDVVVVAKGLDHAWAVEPLPGGDLLVSEKPGRLRIVAAAGALGPPIEGVPAVDDDGQGGLLDVALSPSFAADRTIFWSYTEPRRDGNSTSVARGVLSQDGRDVGEVKVIFRALPVYDGTKHFGSRLAFGPDGMLYVYARRALRPRDPPAGAAPGQPHGQDRPHRAGRCRPERQPLRRTGRRAPRDLVARTSERAGRRVRSEGPALGRRARCPRRRRGEPRRKGRETTAGRSSRSASSTAVSRSPPPRPSAKATPRPSTTGTRSSRHREWSSTAATRSRSGRETSFVGGLASASLVRLTLENDRITGEEHLLADRKRRIRDVREGTDGALYVVTDHGDGELWRIAPRQ